MTNTTPDTAMLIAKILALKSRLPGLIERHFPLFMYFFALSIYSLLLFQLRQYGLLPMPIEGTDQRTMLLAAADLYRLNTPVGPYLLSPGYTLFLTVLIALSQGNLVVMRFLQAALCALTPVMIYRLGRRLRFGRDNAMLAAFLFCFHGATTLITLDFLRAAPLALCFLSYIYFFVRAIASRRLWHYILAGLFAGLCLLGRENFIPIILMPSLLLFWPKLRRRIPCRGWLAYSVTLLLLLSPIVAYNLIRHGSPSIIPGNLANVLGFYHGQRLLEAPTAALPAVARNIPLQVFKFASSYEIPNSLSYYSHRDVADVLWIFIVPFNFLVALAVAAAFIHWRHLGVMLLAVMVAAYLATMVYFDMFYRFRIPCVPILCLLAGMAIGHIARNIRQQRIIPAIAGIVLAGIIFALTITNPNHHRTSQERTSTAMAIIATGQLVKAERYLRKMNHDGIDTSDLDAMFLYAQRQRE